MHRWVQLLLLLTYKLLVMLMLDLVSVGTEIRALLGQVSVRM